MSITGLVPPKGGTNDSMGTPELVPAWLNQCREALNQRCEETLEGLQSMQDVLAYLYTCWGLGELPVEADVQQTITEIPPEIEQELLQVQMNCKRIAQLVKKYLEGFANEMPAMIARLEEHTRAKEHEEGNEQTHQRDLAMKQ